MSQDLHELNYLYLIYILFGVTVYVTLIGFFITYVLLVEVSFILKQ